MSEASAEEQQPKRLPFAFETRQPFDLFWNGFIWHGGGTRTIDGERVVLHITFSRLAMCPIENYDFLGEDWLEGRPYEMRVMLGREDFLNRKGTLAELDKIANTMNWAKT